MSIIGPPDRAPDALAYGMRWCPSCGLHAFPNLIGQTILRNATACPCCVDYDKPVQQKPVAHTVTWLTDDSQRIPREAS